MEAMHASAGADVPKMLTELASALADVWSASARAAVLSAAEPTFAIPPG
ncbi:hypothetical protein OG799_10330 [Micromonospora sp. NBC_00898]|nr:hypothetical protein OG799_10330 [Micromonospora sp. NBC_00898]